MDHTELYHLWLEKAVKDPALRSELKEIREDAAAIEDRFYRELEFGTGGLRGILGAGTNRMNIYTVAKATQGLGNYLRRLSQNPSAAIGYDSRVNSVLFAETAAAVFAANGVRVRLYPRLMPTPSLSFAVRDLGCSCGVMVTASHNPANYNGYKVYGADGCQITTAAAEAIQREIDRVDPFDDVRMGDFGEALRSGTVQYIGEDTADRYLAAVAGTSLLPRAADRAVSIVYTPLNGAGISCVPRCLREQGFTDLRIPAEQEQPDGRFPTCPAPNPENRDALAVAIRLAEQTGAELVLATDPDCDRVGTAVRTESGYQLLTGNEMGILLLDFVCRQRKAQGTLPERPLAVKTIVTTPMARALAEHYGVETVDVLTGFKFIGEQIGLLEKKGEEKRYIFGFEESYGYLSGSFVRDKDGVNASLLICEMTAYYKAQGKKLTEVLEELYQAYGRYQCRLCSFTFEGSAGLRKMRKVMEKLRTERPAELGGCAVTSVTDYLHDTVPGLGKSDVLRFFLAGGHEAVLRPSGTEPKLKLYLTAVGTSRENGTELLDRLEHAVRERIGV